jgi:hypothetical protein
MVRSFVIALFLCLLCGCGEKAGRMEQPEDPHGRYGEQIAVARRVLEQKENWADRAEWEVKQNDDGWKIIAWRVEHPEKRGADRYLPWGYSVIELDRRLVAIHYSHGKR